MGPGSWKRLGVVGATLPLWIPAFAGITMALRRPHKTMKIAGCRGSLPGKKLRRCGVPHAWTPAPYLGTGHAFDRRSDELGVYFHSNPSCRLVPAHQGMKMGPGRLEVFGCDWCHPSPLVSRFRGNDELGGRNDENAEWRGSTARSKVA